MSGKEIKILLGGLLLTYIGFLALFMPKVLIGGSGGILGIASKILGVLPEKAQAPVARVAGLFLGCFGLFALYLPFAPEAGYQEEWERMNSPEAKAYTESVVSHLRSVAPENSEVFATDDPLEVCLLSYETFHYSLGDISGGFFEEVAPQDFGAQMWEAARSGWTSPGYNVHSTRVFSVDEDRYDPSEDTAIQALRPLPPLERADFHLTKAAEAWQAKNKGLSLYHAHEAHYVRRANLGDEDPKVGEVRQQIAWAMSAEP